VLHFYLLTQLKPHLSQTKRVKKLQCIFRQAWFPDTEFITHNNPACVKTAVIWSKQHCADSENTVGSGWSAWSKGRRPPGAACYICQMNRVNSCSGNELLQWQRHKHCRGYYCYYYYHGDDNLTKSSDKANLFTDACNLVRTCQHASDVISRMAPDHKPTCPAFTVSKLYQFHIITPCRKTYYSTPHS